MRCKFLLSVFIGCGIAANAQVGIGTTTPDASAQLHVESPGKGMLIPRVTSTTDVTNPASKATITKTEKNNCPKNKQGGFQKAMHRHSTGANVYQMVARVKDIQQEIVEKMNRWGGVWSQT